MASLRSSPPSLLLFPATLVLLLLFFIPAAFSTSRILATTLAAHHDRPKQPTGFRIGLRHVDSGLNLTRSERLRRGMHRGRSRLHRFGSGAVLAADSSSAAGEEEVRSPVQAGSGEFLMALGIGTPAEEYSAIMDTGSDLIWTQCKPCTKCYKQSAPIFDPGKSSSFSQLSCSSNLCAALPSSSCGDDGCEYLYAYGDYSSTQGAMGTETFTFGSAARGDRGGAVAVPGLAFGCGEDNDGAGFEQGSGLVGLGRGPLSLVSQLDEPKFSYCLTGIDDTKASSLLLGSAAASPSANSTITTKLIRNPTQPSFYFISLEGITVGSTRLPINKTAFEIRDDGTGGLIIDSGTTLTYLEQGVFDLVKKEFAAQTKMPVDDSGAGGLDLCFTLDQSGSGSSSEDTLSVPRFAFHFEGADLELPPENYIISDSDAGLACLAMGASTGMSILGNIQQQNMLVLHDLKDETLSFIPTQCDKL